VLTSYVPPGLTDGLGRGDVGICPACGASRLGATDGPGSFQFAEGSECLHCGHVAVADGRQNVGILEAKDSNGEAVEPLDDEEPE